jgi:hypothetical protein
MWNPYLNPSPTPLPLLWPFLCCADCWKNGSRGVRENERKGGGILWANARVRARFQHTPASEARCVHPGLCTFQWHSLLQRGGVSWGGAGHFREPQASRKRSSGPTDGRRCAVQERECGSGGGRCRGDGGDEDRAWCKGGSGESRTSAGAAAATGAGFRRQPGIRPPGAMASRRRRHRDSAPYGQGSTTGIRPPGAIRRFGDGEASAPQGNRQRVRHR